MGILIIGTVKPAAWKEVEEWVEMEEVEGTGRERGTGKRETGGLEAVSRRGDRYHRWQTLSEVDHLQE